jgi:hypothetical protein
MLIRSRNVFKNKGVLIVMETSAVKGKVIANNVSRNTKKDPKELNFSETSGNTTQFVGDFHGSKLHSLEANAGRSMENAGALISVSDSIGSATTMDLVLNAFLLSYGKEE